MGVVKYVIAGLPVFQRRELSAEDRKAQEEMDAGIQEFVREMSEVADEIELSQNDSGTVDFRIKIDLQKDGNTDQEKPKWWTLRRWWPRD